MLSRLGFWVLLLALLAGVALPSSAQLSCSTQSQAVLLPQFSDNAAAGSIAPANVRNIICSDIQLLAAGATAQPQVVISSPANFAATQAGYLTVSSGLVQITRGATTVTASLTGGHFKLVANDLVVITWFGLGAGSIPVVTWFPDG